MTNKVQVSHKQFFNAPQVQQKFQEVLKGNEKQFTTSLLSIVTNNSLLSRASNESIMTAAMKAAVLNLPIEPSLGFAYIVPYKQDAQFQLGYKGLIQLAIRSGQFKSINAGTVYKAQFKCYDPLFETLDVDFTQPADEVHGYFATFELINGFKKLVYWTKEQAEAHGKRFSKTYSRGPWATDFDSMAKKTALKDILGKYAPLSTEMQEAIVADNEDSTVNDSQVKDVTPEGNQSDLAELMGVSDEELSQETEQPTDELPVHDVETGEVVEEVSFFEGDTTKIKEQD